MLQDDLEQAKFGWSHCLNLPLSEFGLSSAAIAEAILVGRITA